ncbi:MAG: hypothetical protein H7X94_13210 [Vallitaleaceae bacterium]|nr:hypothetical protein [Vallitaleaceae bacterium]
MQSFSVNKRSIIGLIIILIGAAFFLDTLGIIETEDIFETYWPLLLIFFGGISLIDRSTRNSFGVILIIVGLFYQIKLSFSLFQEVEIWNLIWPVIIVVVGFWFIFPKRKHTYSIDSLNSTAVFSGADVINTSQDFKGGEITAIFGGLDIDLRQTNIVTEEPIIIDAFTAFGGIDIKVPEDWRVDVRGLPLFGGWENKRSANKVGPNANKILIVKCLILFGGISIK